MRLDFIKMEGLGNDFILLDDPAGREHLTEEAIRFLCDRHFGIGADGILISTPSTRADRRMLIYNSDGSEARMCGNGIRCFALFLSRESSTPRQEWEVETRAGIIRPRVLGDGRVEVDMGEPLFAPELIPVNLPQQVVDYPVVFAGRTLAINCVSMGNPHCVIFWPPEEEPPVTELGPIIERHELFPDRINVEFARVLNERELDLVVWERGAGLTLACGTGACATLAAAVRTGRTERQARVRLPGGDLEIEWRADNRILMTGPATEVFTGTIELPRPELGSAPEP